MTDAEITREEDRDALLTRLKVIEDQPLDARAATYQGLHDALQVELEGGEART